MPSPNSPRVTRSISIRKDVAESAQDRATRENRTLSNLIETLLIEEREEIRKPTPKSKEARA